VAVLGAALLSAGGSALAGEVFGSLRVLARVAMNR
jgi:hypothetical protein